MRIFKFIYTFFLISIIIFSYTFVDANFPLPANSIIWKLTSLVPFVKTLMYVSMLIIFYVLYGMLLTRIKRCHYTAKYLWSLIALTVVLLLMSFPAFSYDIFNYIASAKVTFLYRENPYIVMPIELTNEPILAFMHAANKTALYGPSWILFTGVPILLSGNNLFLSIFLFKLLVALFYIGTCILVWLMSKKNTLVLALFALNPLVVIESLISGHNDIVMMFFALCAFYLLNRKIFILSFLSLIISVLIKYATIFILPAYAYAFILTIQNKTVNWNKIWYYSFILLSVIFFLSPLREELYSWYFIWPFSILVLTPKNQLPKFIFIALSLGLLLRFAPFVYFKDWGGLTPIIKLAVTLLLPVIGLLGYPLYRKNSK